jgi:hypothetical protein
MLQDLVDYTSKVIKTVKMYNRYVKPGKEPYYRQPDYPSLPPSKDWRSLSYEEWLSIWDYFKDEYKRLPSILKYINVYGLFFTLASKRSLKDRPYIPYQFHQKFSIRCLLKPLMYPRWELSCDPGDVVYGQDDEGLYMAYRHMYTGTIRISSCPSLEHFVETLFGKATGKRSKHRMNHKIIIRDRQKMSVLFLMSLASEDKEEELLNAILRRRYVYPLILLAHQSSSDGNLWSTLPWELVHTIIRITEDGYKDTLPKYFSSKHVE